MLSKSQCLDYNQYVSKDTADIVRIYQSRVLARHHINMPVCMTHPNRREITALQADTSRKSDFYMCDYDRLLLMPGDIQRGNELNNVRFIPQRSSSINDYQEAKLKVVVAICPVCLLFVVGLSSYSYNLHRKLLNNLYNGILLDLQCGRIIQGNRPIHYYDLDRDELALRLFYKQGHLHIPLSDGFYMHLYTGRYEHVPELLCLRERIVELKGLRKSRTLTVRCNLDELKKLYGSRDDMTSPHILAGMRRMDAAKEPTMISRGTGNYCCNKKVVKGIAGIAGVATGAGLAAATTSLALLAVQLAEKAKESGGMIAKYSEVVVDQSSNIFEKQTS